jgi:hypothetical protein
MRPEFLAYKEEASKRMKEIKKRIESFSPPRTAPASQAPPITPTSPAVIVTKKRKKRAVEATKIHPHRRPTKPPSSSRKLAHLGCKFIRHHTQPSKRTVINSRRTSMSLGVICVHCGAKEIKKRAFVWVWFYKKETRTKNKKAKVIPQLSCPIALFSCYNPILKRGVGKFMFTIKDVGIQGLVVPDVPLDEIEVLRKEATSNGQSQAPGFLDGYAFLISGLLDLFEFDGRIKWLLWAETEQGDCTYQTAISGDRGPNATEIYQKESSDSVQRFVFRKFDQTEATWEDQDMAQVQILDFFLGDKEDVRGEG